MRCHKQNFRDIRNEVSSLRGKICSLDSRVNNIIQKIEKHSLNYSQSSSLTGIVFVPFTSYRATSTYSYNSMYYYCLSGSRMSCKI